MRQSRHDTEQTYMGVFIYDLGKQDRPWHPTAAHQMSGIQGWVLLHIGPCFMWRSLQAPSSEGAMP